MLTALGIFSCLGAALFGFSACCVKASGSGWDVYSACIAAIVAFSASSVAQLYLAFVCFGGSL